MSRSCPAMAGWSARAFASRADDLDTLVDAAMPAASTDALLMACLEDGDGRSPGLAQVRAWSVAERLDALVVIRCAGGAAAEGVVLTCPDTRCAASFEAEVELEAIRQQDFEREVAAEHDGRPLPLRVPTGDDHVRWQCEHFGLPQIAASLLQVNGRTANPIDDALLDRIDAALARADSLRNLKLEIDCPACGQSGIHTLNLEPQLLRAFVKAQREWLGDIATVAGAFHWPEREIAALPAWRRAFYLRQARAMQEGRGP